MEVIGNHTDYNGGTVVGAAIEMGISVAMGPADDGRIRMVSDARNGDAALVTSMTTYDEDDLPDWCDYPLGIIDEARLREWIPSGAGLNMAIHSTLPIGTGLSSSAALELAVAGALTRLFFPEADMPTKGQLVEVAHRAENRYVGMPCGLLDQTVVGFARQQHLVVLDAALGRSLSIKLPENLGFVLFRSHISHSLVDSPYEERHRECREALMGLQRFIPGIRHLARLHPTDLDAYASVLETRPALRARHVVHEQRRVGAFLAALSKQDSQAAGACMTASHESSRAFFDNSTPELDALAATAVEREGVLGARLSGGGWGGAVIALVDETFSDEQAESICDTYEELFEVRPHWWRTAASDGFSHERLSD
jgi:galactokinase